MSEDKYVNIVLTGDENYVMPMGVAMYSIIRNLSPNKTARFFLFVSGWSDIHEKQIRQVQNCEIVIMPVEKHLHYFDNAETKKFKLEYIHSLAPYYRLLIPKILPEYVDKAFYFDADMVADADLSAIYDTMPNDKLLAAVVELVANAGKEKILEHCSAWKEFEKFNRHPDKAPYFNAGFFLMNIKLARDLNIFDEFMSFLKAHPNPPYCDQDTLNAVCGQKYNEKMVYLPLEWNVFCDMNYNVDSYIQVAYNHYSIQKSWQYPKIYHYAGPNKPWINKNVMHYWNVWINYWILSPFAEKNSESIKKHKAWFSIFGIPLINLRISSSCCTPERTIKGYLFSWLPLFKKYKTKLKIYLLGIPLLRITWGRNRFKCYLFSIIPFISIKDKK